MYIVIVTPPHLRFYHGVENPYSYDSNKRTGLQFKDSKAHFHDVEIKILEFVIFIFICFLGVYTCTDCNVHDVQSLLLHKSKAGISAHYVIFWQIACMS